MAIVHLSVTLAFFATYLTVVIHLYSHSVLVTRPWLVCPILYPRTDTVDFHLHILTAFVGLLPPHYYTNSLLGSMYHNCRGPCHDSHDGGSCLDGGPYLGVQSLDSGVQCNQPLLGSALPKAPNVVYEGGMDREARRIHCIHHHAPGILRKFQANDACRNSHEYNHRGHMKLKRQP